MDQAIIAQQKEISSQIASEQDYLVSETVSFDVLLADYARDEEFLKRIEELKSCNNCLRRIRSDGNCFYRAFGFSLFEAFQKDQTDCDKLIERLVKIKEELVSIFGYQEFTVTDFHETFVDELKRCITPSEKGKNPEVADIEAVFNDSGLSNYIVVYLRLVTSAQLQIDQDFYVNFLDGAASVKDFCSQEVEPFDKEADHVQIMALTSATGICVRVHCMERGHNSVVTFPSDGTPVINLLYRPGHYDILYPN